MSEQARNLERGLWGGAMPVRPVQPGGFYRRCPQGHDLAIAGARSGYSHRYQLADVTCTACKDLGDPTHQLV